MDKLCFNSKSPKAFLETLLKAVAVPCVTLFATGVLSRDPTMSYHLAGRTEGKVKLSSSGGTLGRALGQHARTIRGASHR